MKEWWLMVRFCFWSEEVCSVDLLWSLLHHNEAFWCWWWVYYDALQAKVVECFFPLCNSAMPSLGAFWRAFILCLAFAIWSYLIFYVVSMAKQPFIALEFTNKIEYVHTLEYIIHAFAPQRNCSFVRHNSQTWNIDKKKLHYPVPSSFLTCNSFLKQNEEYINKSSLWILAIAI